SALGLILVVAFLIGGLLRAVIFLVRFFVGGFFVHAVRFLIFPRVGQDFVTPRGQHGGGVFRAGRDGAATGGFVVRRQSLHPLPVGQGDEDVAGLAAVVLTHDAVFGHEVDQPGGAAVADAQSPLQERDAAAAFADDQIDRGLVQIVALLQGAQLGGVFLRLR